LISPSLRNTGSGEWGVVEVCRGSLLPALTGVEVFPPFITGGVPWGAFKNFKVFHIPRRLVE